MGYLHSGKTLLSVARVTGLTNHILTISRSVNITISLRPLMFDEHITQKSLLFVEQIPQHRMAVKLHQKEC